MKISKEFREKKKERVIIETFFETGDFKLLMRSEM